MKKKVQLLLCCLSILFYDLVSGAEGASGVYILGCQGPMAGFLPPPGFYLRHDDYFYEGNVDKAVLGGQAAFAIDAHCFLDFTTFSLVTPLKFFGANYAIGAVLPLGKVAVRADVEIEPLSFDLSKKQTDSGYTDMILQPIILGWHFQNLHTIVSLSVFLPTGHYETKRLANIGKNHFAFDFGGGFTWQQLASGIEVSNWMGYTVNLKNKETEYKTGGEFHTELFFGKSLGEIFQLGLVGYYYKQFTGDSGQGALFGSFKGQAIGLGPLLLGNFKVRKTPITFNARYYKEFDTKNRLKGESFFVTFSLPLAVFSSHS